MGDWTESNYVETRFGGMDSSHEPHTLDRDGGKMADEFNMVSKSQGLRTRKGWNIGCDLSLSLSSIPGTKQWPTALIPYEDNLVTVEEEEEEGEEESSTSAVYDAGGISYDTSSKGGAQKSVRKKREAPLEDLTFSMAVGAVVAQCTFTLSITASGGAYRGNSGLLKALLMPSGEDAGYVHSRGIRQGWTQSASGASWSATGHIDNTVRDQGQLKLSLASGGQTAVEKTVGYGVASMVPSLEPETVKKGEEFSATLSCKYNGTTQAAYAGVGKGVAVVWTAEDEDGGTVSCSVSRKSASWSGGVCSMVFVLDKIDVTAVLLTMTVTYAGEEKTASASVDTEGTASITECPSYLHVYGDAEELKIAAYYVDEPPTVVIVDAQGNDVTSKFKDGDGRALDFGEKSWSEAGIWEGTVMADVEVTAGTYTLKVMKGASVLDSSSFTLSRTVVCTFSGADTVAIDLDFSMEFTAESENGTLLPRIVKLLSFDVSEGLTVDFSTPTGWSSSMWGRSNCRASSNGTVTAKMGDDVLATKSITAVAVRAALAAAINERNAVTQNGSAAYTATDSMSTLSSAAITAMSGTTKFIREFTADAGAVEFTSATTGISTSQGSMTEPQWAADTYFKLIKAVSIQTTSYSTVREAKSGTSNNVARSTSQEGGETIFSETREECQERAEHILENAYGEASGDGTAYAYFEKYYWESEPGETFMHAFARCSKSFYRLKARCDYNWGSALSRKVKWVFKTDTTAAYVFDGMGHGVPASGKYGYLLGEQTAGANESFTYSDYHASTLDFSRHGWTSSSDAYSWGYCSRLQYAVLEFGFAYRG